MLYASERFLIFYLVSKNITNICKKNVCFCTKYVDKERQRDDGVTQWIRQITYIFLVRYKSRWHFFTRVLIFMRSLYTWSAHSPARQQNKPHWQSRNCFFSLLLSSVIADSLKLSTNMLFLRWYFIHVYWRVWVWLGESGNMLVHEHLAARVRVEEKSLPPRFHIMGNKCRTIQKMNICCIF